VPHKQNRVVVYLITVVDVHYLNIVLFVVVVGRLVTRHRMITVHRRFQYGVVFVHYLVVKVVGLLFSYRVYDCNLVVVYCFTQLTTLVVF